MTTDTSLIDSIRTRRDIDAVQLHTLLEQADEHLVAALRCAAQEQAVAVYGHDIYVRGLIEISNICRNNCYYCGIRRDNRKVQRYRLDKETILACCRTGYELGFRTFVLQGGEDAYYDDSRLCDIVGSIKHHHPDCAVTLSLGERSRESYRLLREAGADRYLLRHETADDSHYRQLHPDELSPVHRKECLFNLKELGYQVGAGFMVGSPHQTVDHLMSDIRFLQELQPDMIGIGPFLSHSDTPFHDQPDGDSDRCLRMLAILRLLFPKVLLPATTALGTADPLGREKGILYGGNVLMPNLSPMAVRKKYMLYDNKICTGDEAAECRACLSKRMEMIGYRIVVDRGDVKKI
ncbi:MAG: iron-only hydrogenase maturation protein HydE [bacterium P3]|nr:MAG: iron-only hydrogenase maturation protein HydE [bacterium P201]KWW30470.1 MAG: iron-only hydrogenase maturation protein HydE [bacterium P3]KWW41357.1 MAG: iron-only hydrogenase maturation protein HydE [bacterium F083]